VPLTVSVRPHSRALTTVARVRQEFRIPTSDVDEERDEFMETLILEASDLIQKEIQQELFRARLIETVVGSGRSEMMLTRTPIAEIVSITDNVTDEEYDLDDFQMDAKAGILINDTWWPNTSHRHAGLIVPQESDDLGHHQILVDYWAGVFSPTENIMASGVPVLGDGYDTFVVDDPPLLVAGDIIETVGFANEDNNGQFTVAMRTASGIQVVGDLISEVGNADSRINVRTLDRGLERLCVQTIKSWMLGAEHDPNVSSERIGDWSASWGNSSAGEYVNDLPASVCGSLQKYVRIV